MDPTTIDAIAKSLTPIVVKMINSAGKSLVTKAGSASKNLLDKAIANFQIGFQEFLSSSYLKCKLVKTIVNPHEPVDVLDIYVNLFLTCGNIRLLDDDLIASISSHKHIVVSGLAGSGKSMFMRYLVLSFFNGNGNKIPLFVELRKLNGLTTVDLSSFIYASCQSSNNNVTKDQFDIFLKHGGFTLIFDGFDEVDPTLRLTVEKQILNMRDQFPDTNIILSSRPDERFNSWQSFYTFQMESMTESQAIQLIEKIDYDRDVKKRFVEKIKKGLFRTHHSFLSNPLLAATMLLTYEQSAEIPNKMYLFYGLAFDTLYHRHDAFKEQYKRKKHTNLDADEFKKCFAAFCAFSYLESKFEFDNESTMYFGKNALAYIENKATVTDFITDLQECVCMLQQEGTNVVFVHRSFQEYFTAVFIKDYRGPETATLIDSLAVRNSDSSLPMLYEMTREMVEQEWILPTLTKYINFLEEELPKGNYDKILSFFMPSFVFHAWTSRDGAKLPADIALTAHLGDVERFNTLARAFALSKLSDNLVKPLYVTLFDDNALKRLPKLILELNLESDARFIGLFRENRAKNRKKSLPSLSATNNQDGKVSVDPNEWLSFLDANTKMNDFLESLKALRNSIFAKNKTQESIIGKIIGALPKKRAPSNRKRATLF